jgi:protein-disulfide isomerase/uncharacterized membrane protein
MDQADVLAAAPRFTQPRPWIRWLAVAAALAGWVVSWQLFLVSAGAQASTLVQALCGGADSGCDSVLTSPQAYVPISRAAEAPKIPVSALGMGYFAFFALWYLLVGPPAQRGRPWHLVPALVGLAGATQSVAYIGIMKYELGRWCGGCLVAHGLNACVLVLTLVAFPWRRAKPPAWPHPTARLALAAGLAGVLLFALHLVVSYTALVLSVFRERTNTYAAVLDDPAFILWDFNRQPAVSIPLREDEVFAGSPDMPNTVVVFGDFQCTACRQAHEMLQQVAAKYPDALRIMFRSYPQDPACNANPRYRSGGHASACRAAQAAEAARLVGGATAYLAMRRTLWDNQNALPHKVYAQQSEAERRIFADWAAAIGLDRDAFTQAMDSRDVAARIQADIELAGRLGVQAVPVVFVNGKRLRNWSKMETWDAILRGTPAPATQP